MGLKLKIEISHQLGSLLVNSNFFVGDSRAVTRNYCFKAMNVVRKFLKRELMCSVQCYVDNSNYLKI